MPSDTDYFASLSNNEQAHVMSIVEDATTQYKNIITNKKITSEVQVLCTQIEAEIERLKEALSGIIMFPNEYDHPRYLVHENIDILCHKIKSLLYLCYSPLCFLLLQQIPYM